jgi:hypothetical protein
MKATFEIDAVQGHCGCGRSRRCVWIEHCGSKWQINYIVASGTGVEVPDATYHKTLREARAAARVWLEEER